VWQLTQAKAIIAAHRAPKTPVVLARSVGRSDEKITLTTLEDLDPAMADMQTVVLVGSSTTRTLSLANHRQLVYTPRSYSR